VTIFAVLDFMNVNLRQFNSFYRTGRLSKINLWKQIARRLYFATHFINCYFSFEYWLSSNLKAFNLNKLMMRWLFDLYQIGGFMDNPNAILTPGMLVLHPLHKEWGVGQVQSNIGIKITINFREKGKVVIDGSKIALVPVFDATQ